MKYILTSSKEPAQLVDDLQEAVVARKFGVLHIHDLKGTLHSKGFDFAHPCWVLEVCQPGHAFNVLTEDMEMNLALPCRISVWQEEGQTKLGMLLPTKLLGILSDSPTLAQIAVEVEEAMKAMLEEAR